MRVWDTVLTRRRECLAPASEGIGGGSAKKSRDRHGWRSRVRLDTKRCFSRREVKKCDQSAVRGSRGTSRTLTVQSCSVLGAVVAAFTVTLSDIKLDQHLTFMLSSAWAND